jgi:hypothetical protein
MKQAALVTLALGQRHLDYWRTWCEPGWRQYAARCGYDLVLLTEPLDRSPAAAGRSPAWQKCLVLGQPFAANYRQLVLLDSDIVINVAAAPPIADYVPETSLGGVISGSQIADDLRPVLLARTWQRQFPYEPGDRLWREVQGEYYRRFGLSPRTEGIVQTGVLVASPQRHREIFEQVYQARWPEAGHRTFEQVPLSHAILSSGCFQRLDARFNSVFYETLLVHHPYLLVPNLPIRDQLAMCAVQAEFENNFFLHFAYDSSFAEYLAPTVCGNAEPEQT